MAEYASLDYDLAGALRLAVTVDRASGELRALSLDQDAVAQDDVQIVASGVERAAIMALPDGSWVTFYNVGTTLFARVSEDEGDSWGAAETLPITLRAVTPGDGQWRFVVAYLPHHRLIALLYTKLVAAVNRTALTALRRDNAGVWTQGAETLLSAADFNTSLPARHALAPLADGQIAYGDGWFISNFGWSTTAIATYRITNLSGAGLFQSPRYLVCVRAVELQSGAILLVGNTLGRDPGNLVSSGAWASAVLWRVGADTWNGLRDSSTFPTQWLAGLANYIAKAPITYYATGAEAAAGYCGACGQMRLLPDGSAELLYHDRSGALAFKRNRMTAYSLYYSPLTPGSTDWSTSRRDTWE